MLTLLERQGRELLNDLQMGIQRKCVGTHADQRKLASSLGIAQNAPPSPSLTLCLNKQYTILLQTQHLII